MALQKPVKRTCPTDGQELKIYIKFNPNN